MKKFKWILTAILMVSILLSTCALAEAVRTPAPYRFDLAEGAEQYVENLIFNGDVVISGNNAVLTFANCEFNGNIILTSELGTRVMLMDDCSINGQLVVDCGVAEGTFETSLPKFLVFAPAEVVLNNCYGAVIALGDFEIIFDGAAYTIADAQLYFDNTAPENGFVPYDGQETHLFVVAKWQENGEEVLLVECEYAP